MLKLNENLNSFPSLVPTTIPHLKLFKIAWGIFLWLV